MSIIKNIQKAAEDTFSDESNYYYPPIEQLTPDQLRKLVSGGGGGSGGNGSGYGGYADAPALPKWNDVTTDDGLLEKGYRLTDPKDVKTSVVKADKVKAGKDVKASIAGEDYSNVKIASAQKEVDKQLAGNKVDQRGIDAIRERALATGPSAWATLQGKKQQQDEKAALDNVRAQTAGAVAGAQNQMAMRGGLSSGASNRIAANSVKDRIAASQGVRRQGQQDRMNLAIADEANKTDLLKTMPTTDLANAAFGLDKTRLSTDVRLTEQGNKLQADTGNAERNLESDQFNAAAKNDITKFNRLNDIDAQKFNSAQGLTAQTTNAANTLDQGKFNVANDMHAQEYNSSQALAGVNSDRDYAMREWQTRMMGYGADKTAAAIANGGGKK